MAAEGGLGRSLADIRRDLERVAHESLILGPAGSRLLGDVHRLTEGAEPRGAEFAQLTAGEAWGMLLAAPAEKRLRWLGNVLEQGRQGNACWELDHAHAVAELARYRRSLMPTRERVEELCELMHDAYETAAAGAGWETQEASRKPWADVPEANKATMRASVLALLVALAQYRPLDLEGPADA